MAEKLIRNRIPEIAADAGNPLTVRTADPSELADLLPEKLLEETREAIAAAKAIDASPDELIWELADVFEVLLALAALHGHTPSDVEQARAAKAKARGGFEQRFVMQLPSKEA